MSKSVRKENGNADIAYIQNDSYDGGNGTCIHEFFRYFKQSPGIAFRNFLFLLKRGNGAGKIVACAFCDGGLNGGKTVRIDKYIVYKIIQGYVNKRTRTKKGHGEGNADEPHVAVNGNQPVCKMVFARNMQDMRNQMSAQYEYDICQKHDESARKEIGIRGLRSGIKDRAD